MKAIHSERANPFHFVICAAGLNTPLACLAILLRLSGHGVRVFCAEKTSKPSYDHDFTYRLLRHELGFDIKPPEAVRFEEGHRLVLGWAHWLPWQTAEINRIRSRLPPKAKMTLVYDSAYGSYASRLLAQMKEVRKHPWLWSRLRNVVFCGDPRRPDLFGLFRRSGNFMPSPSTDFLTALLGGTDRFTIQNRESRAHRFHFAGAGHRVRLSILEACRDLWGIADCLQVDKRQSNTAYVETLSNSDFSLCMPGGLVWSHRITEAILAGSIPVLGREAYRFVEKIVPEEAVLLVPKDRDPRSWRESVLRATRLSVKEIEMKRSVLLALRNNAGPLAPQNQVATWLDGFELTK